jgi:hypothetical protein
VEAVLILGRNHGSFASLVAGMQTIQQVNRRSAPAGRPFGLAFLDGTLWVGSWDTDKIYALDPQAWTVRREVEAPGRPYGIVALGNELRVVIAHGEEEDRYLYRLDPREGFDLASKTPCPDFTGSFLTSDGSTLYLGQMGFRRILILKPDATAEREIALPTRCAGLAFGPDRRFYMISADEEFEQLQFGTLDISKEAPPFEAISPLPEEARGLLHHGNAWWTSLRDANEVASFTV